jgi:hypothetical protein
MDPETVMPDETSQPEEAEYQEEVEQDVTAEDEGDESQDQTEPEDDSEEIEFNSKAYKLPREIASAVKDMQKDYTQKNQANAEQRKALETQAQFHQENIKEVAQLEAINSSLSEFAQVDWGVVMQQDPAMFQQLVAQQKQLEERRNLIAGNLNAKYQKSTEERKLQEAKLSQESETEIKRLIKDWSPELDSKLQKFAADRYGFPKESVGEYKKDPKIAKLLHDAYVGQQIIQKQTTRPKTVQQANPVPTVSGSNSSSKKSIFEADGDEFDKMRAKQIAARRSR